MHSTRLERQVQNALLEAVAMRGVKGSAGKMEIGGILVIAFYFLPAIIAASRQHLNAGAILVLNLLLGWTVLGWIAALIWSLTNPAVVQIPQSVSSELPKASAWKDWGIAFLVFAVIVLLVAGNYYYSLRAGI